MVEKKLRQQLNIPLSTHFVCYPGNPGGAHMERSRLISRGREPGWGSIGWGLEEERRKRRKRDRSGRKDRINMEKGQKEKLTP